MANMYENKLPDPVSPLGMAMTVGGQQGMILGENYIKATDRNAELQAEEIKRMALAEVAQSTASFNQGMAIEGLDLDKAKLEETKRGNLVQERQVVVAETRLANESAARIKNMEEDARLRERALDDARERHTDSMSIDERRVSVAESNQRLQESIADENWKQADRELEFQKEKFGWTKNIEQLKIDQADQSIAETQRQFDANISIRQQELAITEARLTLDTNTAEDRQVLDERKVDIQEELKELEVRRTKVIENKAAQEELYQTVILELKEDAAALAERSLEIEEDKLVIAQGKADRDKWVFHQIKTGEETVQVEGADTVSTMDDIYKTIDTYEFVAINVDEPELMDVRTWTEDGWSGGGAPDLNADLLKGIEAVNHIINSNPSLSVDEAIDRAASKMSWDGWDKIRKIFYSTRKTNSGYYGKLGGDTGQDDTLNENGVLRDAPQTGITGQAAFKKGLIERQDIRDLGSRNTPPKKLVFN
jgi:hypothetical protein